MNTDLGQDSIDQLAFWQREIRIMIAGKDVAEEQCHPNLCEGGHASAHDPHSPSHHASCKVLSRNAQQLAYGFLIKSQSLAPPFTELATLPLLQDQPQGLVDGIFVIGDPLAPHPGALIPDSFLGGPCICIEFHDYFQVIFSHGPCELSPFPLGNFLLELSVLPLS